MKKLYSVEQIAEQWGLSIRTIRRYIADGNLTHYKIGGRVKVSENHIIVFLESCEY